MGSTARTCVPAPKGVVILLAVGGLCTVVQALWQPVLVALAGCLQRADLADGLLAEARILPPDSRLEFHAKRHGCLAALAGSQPAGVLFRPPARPLGSLFHALADVLVLMLWAV